MASAFSFGFSGDDIDIDEADTNDLDERDTSLGHEAGAALPGLVEARRHDMEEWISTLPSQISYNKLTIDSAGDAASETKPLTIARREVFDIRAQLMAEDSADEENGELIAGLEKGDIKPNFYEGGFKTWECSIDLAKLVSSEEAPPPPPPIHSSSEEDRHIIELGAGTAIPSLALFAQLLSQTDSGPTRKTHFTFADYNSAVLRLVTLPNLLLTWNYFVTLSNADPSSASTGQPEDGPAGKEKEEEELDITPELVENFQRDLTRRRITINFISGAWSPAFVDLVFPSEELSRCQTTVLASETIYSPASLVAFSETLIALLRRPEAGTKALIAAKKVYFGVGGGIDEFLAVLRTAGGSDVNVKELVDIKSEGVGRIILEIGVNRA